METVFPSQLLNLLSGLRQQLDQVRGELDRVHSATTQPFHTLTANLQKALEAERGKRQALEQTLYETLLRVATALDYRDRRSSDRLTRLSQYTMLLALQFGLPEAEVQLLYSATPLYDLGKIGIPDAVLLKPGRLEEVERTIVEIHPTLGTSLLSGADSPLLDQARQIALTHHEHWDGSGYPQGLKGEDIPLGGRLVILAEQYEVLRSTRPHKPAFDHARACHILFNGDERTRPAHFDPRLLEAFRVIHGDFAAIYDRRTI